MYCKSYPVQDSDQRCVSHSWQRGGNASNSCSVFAEFNVPIEILGAMSYDIGGQFMKKDFEEYGICIENCHFYEEYESPISTNLINIQNGSRTIVHSNKNMPEVTFEDFKCLDLNNYSWIHFECRPYYEDLKKMIKHIREWNAEKNHDPIIISIEIEKPRMGINTMDVVAFGDFIFISKDFGIACGYSDMTSAVKALSSSLKPGAVIICPWGEKGACARTADGSVVVSEAYPPEKILTTLGAGDTFIAATIIALLKGEEVVSAIDIGCKVAGAKCGMYDTKGLAKLFPFLL
ncbi:ketohexokinase [Trichonephila clavipes]|nr:ketohexokinase [Trichonephila clavipes]